jgi:hypothetical protein
VSGEIIAEKWDTPEHAYWAGLFAGSVAGRVFATGIVKAENGVDYTPLVRIRFDKDGPVFTVRVMDEPYDGDSNREPSDS